MVQVLKEAVRQRIRAAALAEFAATGAARATIGAIAQRAGVGAATVYSYYASKEELLFDVLPPALAKEFERKLVRRVRSLALLPTMSDESFAATHASADDILKFWLRHRLEVVVLLDRAEGSAYADFGPRFVRRLVSLSLAILRAQQPALRVTREERLVLTLIFENTRRLLATLLERCPSERAARDAFKAFWAYQLPGLRGFSRAVLARAARDACR